MPYSSIVATVQRMAVALGILSLMLGATPPRPALAQFALVEPGEPPAKVLVPRAEPEPVRLAAEDLVRDVRKITGQKPEIVEEIGACAARCLILGTVSNEQSRKLLNQFVPDAISGVKGEWEGYRVQSKQLSSRVGPVESSLIVAGSDTRGTMFGLYEFIEQYLEVDPLYFWTGREPEKRDRLAWQEVALSADEPTFRYRGWFLNDEDLLVEWHDGGGQRFIPYDHYHDVTAASVHKRVFEAMLRLGMNLVIPASFNDIANPAERRAIEMATRRGLFVSMHHIEPMGVSAYAYDNYFDRKGESRDFSFVKHPEAFKEVWRHYANLWSKYPNVIWQLGLRGIADEPYWGADPSAPQTAAERGQLISKAVALQWEIVQEVDERPNPLATTTLWMEGARLHRQGHLTFPKEVAMIFSDNSPGWTWQDDFYEVPRQPSREYGIYYHHQLWGSGPHFAQAVPVRKSYNVLGEAVERGDTYYAILNVGNVREFVLGLAASAAMLRGYANFDPSSFLRRWTEERFGNGASLVRKAYQQYFDAYVEESIEYQGTQRLPVWLDGRTTHRGKAIFARLLSRVTVPSAETALFSEEKLSTWLEQVRRQRRGLERTGTLTEKAAAKLEEEDLRFLETNLEAQKQIVLGLTKWVEAGIRAMLAEHEGEREEMREHVRAAAHAFDRVRAGQHLAAQGRFEDWYEGDRKMNLNEAEALTRRLQEGLGMSHAQSR